MIDSDQRSVFFRRFTTRKTVGGLTRNRIRTGSAYFAEVMQADLAWTSPLSIVRYQRRRCAANSPAVVILGDSDACSWRSSHHLGTPDRWGNDSLPAAGQRLHRKKCMGNGHVLKLPTNAGATAGACSQLPGLNGGISTQVVPVRIRMRSLRPWQTPQRWLIDSQIPASTEVHHALRP